ncbi:MAG: transcriptional regulator NrdR [Candidatus Magasanikbacteria bacterium RIFCSPLOWO2_02_FULL_44_11]|uniref:Transcriptional repressor NrdR n=2 Tax=Candidatus Magasanikiibacteriota TaxID=1752731 RepID=A0A1F6N9K8_9BACT|nr:MAG: transcriptional regulator NrdR [Candidatus Magasanikbacteria bacterium RIFCSPHIGHO2_02_FULL_45_10]OGH80468.1 MAG: transcriptional regulator NrdR [Candidatus Magasanikbacteria bacterium RIFCSPLOWO2_02_FULL_44_11]
MRCPVCNHSEVSVVDTRSAEDDLSVRRRRECEKCAYRFSTIEEIELLDIIVVKQDGERQSYMRDKVENGIRRSLTKRPYTQEKFHRLIHAIERDIQKKRRREIASKEIGEIVMKHLETFDKVAYIRFSSVYRDFKDVKTFERELKRLSKKR